MVRLLIYWYDMLRERRNGNMAKYIVEDRKTSKYEKNYKMPMINIIPAVVWSIPVHQKIFPDSNGWVTLGLCLLFVVLVVQ